MGKPTHFLIICAPFFGHARPTVTFAMNLLNEHPDLYITYLCSGTASKYFTPNFEREMKLYNLKEEPRSRLNIKLLGEGAMEESIDQLISLLTLMPEYLSSLICNPNATTSTNIFERLPNLITIEVSNVGNSFLASSLIPVSLAMYFQCFPDARRYHSGVALSFLEDSDPSIFPYQCCFGKPVRLIMVSAHNRNDGDVVFPKVLDSQRRISRNLLATSLCPSRERIGFWNSRRYLIEPCRIQSKRYSIFKLAPSLNSFDRFGVNQGISLFILLACLPCSIVCEICPFLYFPLMSISLPFRWTE